MKGRFLLLLLFILVHISVFSQRFELLGGVDYGNYAMNDLHDLNEDFKRDVEIPLKTTENFPATFSFYAEPRIRVNNIFWGYSYLYASTGSRTCYSDYSGSLNVDIIANSHQIAPLIGYVFYNHDRFDFSLYMKAPLILSKVKIKSNFRLFDNNQEVDNISFISESLGLSPNAEIKYKAGFFYCGLKLGCLLDLGGDLHDSSNWELFFVDDYNNKISTNWSGLRLSLILGINLNR